MGLSERKMGRPGQVAFLLALFVFLGTLHGTRADDYGDYEDEYADDYGNDYDDDGDGAWEGAWDPESSGSTDFDSVTRRGWRLEWSSSPAEEDQPTSGFLTSPNYPEEYQNNLNVRQNIEVPEGNTIWMRFTRDSDIERNENSDVVEVANKDGRILWSSSNDDSWEKRDERFVSITNTVDVLFYTDGSVTYRGWRLEWGMVGDEEDIPKSGVLKSPNYPNSYPNDHDSTQTVEVEEGKIIFYVWTNFHTEGSNRPSGPYDYVEIVDEDGTSLMTKTGGSDLPPPGSSNTNIMHVKFHTDGDTTRAGWRLEWNEEQP